MKKVVLALVAVASAGVLAGCSQGSQAAVSKGAPIGNPIRHDIKVVKNNEDLNTYVNSWNYDESKALAYDLSGTISCDEGTTFSGDSTRLLVTTKTVNTAASGGDCIDTIQNSDTLYPGKLLLADDKLLSGTPTGVDLNRACAKYSVNLPGLVDKAFSVVSSQYNVQSEITKKCVEWAGLGNKRSADMEYSIQTVYSQAQIDTHYGVGFGKKVNISADYKSSSESNTYIISFKDIYFTVNMLMDDPDSAIFADDVTVDQLRSKVTDSKGNFVPPLLITNASYGKEIFFKVETSMSESEVDYAFSYAGKLTNEEKGKFNDLMKSSSISCFVYGGTTLSYGSISKLSADNPAEQICEIFSDDCIQDASNICNNKLLSYTTNFIDHSQRAAKVISTAQYIETSYYYIEQQQLYIKNSGAYAIDDFDVYGYHIDSFNKDTGKPIFSSSKTTLYHHGDMTNPHSVTLQLPADYGRIEFKYNVMLGKKNVFNARVSTSGDFFEDAKIYCKGTAPSPYTECTCDGVYRKI